MKYYIKQLIEAAIAPLQQQGQLPNPLPDSIQIDNARDERHGDFACNIAMVLAKATKQNPRQLAQTIVNNLGKPHHIESIEIAGPGFINFHLSDSAFIDTIKSIIEKSPLDKCKNTFSGKKVHIEFVCANPTGPLHVGHGRGAAYGATVSDLLEAVGYQVHREYYVNDAGRQMHILAASVWLRWMELCDNKIVIPQAAYKGDYVIDIAKKLASHKDIITCELASVMTGLPDDETDKEKHIDALIANLKKQLDDQAYQLIFSTALKSVLDDIKQDLKDFGITYQAWFPESQLVTDGNIDKGLHRLQDNHCIYKKDDATWFRATDYGDEKDRVVVRANGQHTYFGADVGYHLQKYLGNYDKIIDVFGADHHGYIPRIKAFLTALDVPVEKLNILLVQFAILYRGKEKVPMSTRSGEFVTLRELREEVGKDAARFFYIMRKPEQHLDFDLELAKSKSNENPVYYIQYAHARICSVFRQLEQQKMFFDKNNGSEHLALLIEPQEKSLIRFLARFEETVLQAATQYEPHQLAHYLQQLANYFHSYYNSHQFIIDDVNLRNSRLYLISATKIVLANGLELLGVAAPNEM